MPCNSAAGFLRSSQILALRSPGHLMREFGVMTLINPIFAELIKVLIYKATIYDL